MQPVTRRYAKRSGFVSEVPAIPLTSLRVIASAKLWNSWMVIRKAPGPPITFSLKYFGSPPGGFCMERVSRAGCGY